MTRTRADWLIVAVVLTLPVALIWGAVGLVSWGNADRLPRHGARAQAYYSQHRKEFRRVVQLISQGAFAGAEDDYYGVPLPAELEHLSANHRIARQDMADTKQPLFFLPTWLGTPDDAVGFAYFRSPPADGSWFDGFGMRIGPRLALGDGWWWADNGE